ncbi:hypothetical protein C2G38_2194053 [Gigaspora rosea]|uniref:Uncharacterized protein n=1 Tax=Gigaspora rosea TaxID=44941 RepID=A0A397UZJ4_9GLOM|nr:hypothetical protein C2G38_2194053 [Gigaspora rosea]
MEAWDNIEVGSEGETGSEFEAEAESKIEAEAESEIEAEIEVEDLISEISSNYKKEVILDKAAILEEILPQSDSESSSDESVIEIEKISHSVTLEQYRLLMQYVEQQDSIKFVEGQDLPLLRSLLKRIRLNISQIKTQKKVTDFFLKWFNYNCLV